MNKNIKRLIKKIQRERNDEYLSMLANMWGLSKTPREGWYIQPEVLDCGDFFNKVETFKDKPLVRVDLNDKQVLDDK